jgi:hypothetical protein
MGRGSDVMGSLTPISLGLPQIEQVRVPMYGSLQGLMRLCVHRDRCSLVAVSSDVCVFRDYA